jgi:hypothetical protein
VLVLLAKSGQTEAAESAIAKALATKGIGPAVVLVCAAMVGAGFIPNIRGGHLFLLEMALLVALIALFGIASGGRAAGALITPLKLMSLSRFQMLLWMVVILGAYMAIILRRLNLPDPLNVTIDWRLWSLMGINVTSLVGSPIVDATKKSKVVAAGVADTTAKALNQPSAEVTTHARGTLYGNPSASDARFSDMLGGDEVGNAQYTDVTKVQMFFFTVVAALSYGITLYKLIDGTNAADITAFPTLSTGVIALLGLSHTAFLSGQSTGQTAVTAAPTARKPSSTSQN